MVGPTCVGLHSVATTEVDDLRRLHIYDTPNLLQVTLAGIHNLVLHIAAPYRLCAPPHIDWATCDISPWLGDVNMNTKNKPSIHKPDRRYLIQVLCNRIYSMNIIGKSHFRLDESLRHILIFGSFISDIGSMIAISITAKPSSRSQWVMSLWSVTSTYSFARQISLTANNFRATAGSTCFWQQTRCFIFSQMITILKHGNFFVIGYVCLQNRP